MNTMKRCTKCGRLLPLSEFYSDKRNKDGHRGHCKECHNAKTREWRRKHPEKDREYCRKWTREHPEMNRAQTRRHRKSHPEVKRASDAKRRALKRATVRESETAEIKKFYADAVKLPRMRCFHCHRIIPKSERHVDHLTPLAKGGEHRLDNLVVSCSACNSRKSDDILPEYSLLPII